MSAGFRSAGFPLGLSVPPPPVVPRGVRSLLAFWMGGAAVNPGVIPPVSTPPGDPPLPLIGGRPRSWLREDRVVDVLEAPDFTQQNEAIIMVVVSAVTSGSIQ